MKLNKKWTLYAILAITVAGLDIVAAFFFLDTSVLAAVSMLVAGIAVIAILVASFIFARSKAFVRVSSNSKAIQSVSRMTLKYIDAGVILYDKFNRITFVSEYLKNGGLVDVEGLSLDVLFPEIDTSKSDGKIASESAYVINGRSYEVKSVPSIRAVLLKDQTEFEKLFEASINKRQVIGIIKISNLNVSGINALANTEISYKVQKAMSDWSRENDAYFYNSNNNLDNDNWVFIMNFESYRKSFLDTKKTLFDTLNDILNKDANTAVVSIALGFGGATAEDNGLLAEDALKTAEESGSNQVLVKEQNKDILKIGTGKKLITGLDKHNINVFANRLIKKMYDAKNIVIIGHNRPDADSLAAVVATYEIATQFQSEVKIYLDTPDATAKKIYDDMLSDRIKKDIIKTTIGLSKEIKPSTLVIVLDTTSKLQLPKGILDKHDREKLILIDHHLISDQSYKTVALNSYIDIQSSSTSEIMALIIEIVSSRAKRLKISKELAMMMMVGILIDTRSLTNGLSHYTFEAVSLLSKWGALINVASKYSNISINTFLDSNIIMKTIQVIDKKVIIATADNDYIIDDDISLAISGDRLMKVEGIEASFIIARISPDSVKISAREDGNYNISEIAQEMGGGGRENAAAAVIKGKTISEVREELLSVIKKIGK